MRDNKGEGLVLLCFGWKEPGTCFAEGDLFCRYDLFAQPLEKKLTNALLYLSTAAPDILSDPSDGSDGEGSGSCLCVKGSLVSLVSLR